MLDFDAVTKRFGPLTALDRCTFTARPGRLPRIPAAIRHGLNGLS